MLPLPAGVIDTHVHAAPDVVPRSVTDRELVQAASRAGYRGLVLKSHVENTASRARLARELWWPEGEVFGGLVLNDHTSGGFNPTAVETALRLGSRVIWMPTLGAAGASDRGARGIARRPRRWTGAHVLCRG
jgi:hypothetical protein